MLAHHVFPISEVAGCARQSSSEDRAAGGNAAPRSTIDPSDRIVRVSERQSSADGVCYCEACCCMHVCVNVGPLPAVRRDVVDDDVVRSGRVAHGIAARRRSEYAKPNFSYITLIPRSQMSVSVWSTERDREDSGVPAPAERLRPFQKPSTPRNHKPAF
jgi:hypothetical protein